MALQTDLNLFKDKAAAVQVMVSEIMDLQAAFGWDGQDQAALEEACRGPGVHLVADNLREPKLNLISLEEAA